MILGLEMACCVHNSIVCVTLLHHEDSTGVWHMFIQCVPINVCLSCSCLHMCGYWDVPFPP